MQLIHRTPWELRSLIRNQNRLSRPVRHNAFVPAVDIHEEEARFVVLADLPGVDATRIDITIDGDLLTIRGERENPPAADTATVHRAERQRGRFERTFRLPETAANEGFQADYRNGVLTVSVPKAEEAMPYRIEVTAN
jgi:HSP20 family protein